MQRTAISLFSGAGGMDIGVLQAGFDILACIEIDPFACATLRANIERKRRLTDVFQTDIRTVDPHALMQRYALHPGDLDLLFGGPPCQPFSQIGKRGGLADHRGMLLFEMVRYARAIMPRVLIVEQVKGLLNARDERGVKGGVFQQFVHALQAIGYQVMHHVMNAADYGVPQVRERIFIVGARSAYHTRFPPHPTHAPPEQERRHPSRKPYVAIGDALAGLGAPIRKGEGDIPEDSHFDVTPERDRQRIRIVPEGSYLGAQEHAPMELRGRLTRKDTTKFRRLSAAKPSNTLRCGEIFFHPHDDRYLTPREYMRIHGYPDDYLLCGPIRGRSGHARFLDQHRQIANSVPPPVAYAIAQTLRE